MTKPSSVDWSLLAAGVLTSAMALYHFWLPFGFGWPEALSRAPMLRWGLLSINSFFSYLLLAGGAMTITLAAKPAPRDRTSGWLLMSMIGFWLFNLCYQLLIPMPLPQRFAGVRWGLLSFALIVLFLYSMVLWRRRPQPAEQPAPAVITPAVTGHAAHPRSDACAS